MAGEFTKPTSGLTAAQLGKIVDPDVWNQNLAAIAKASIQGVDVDGLYDDFDVGDETTGSTGALVNDIKIRDGGSLKSYDSSGTLVETFSLDQATESTRGTAKLTTDAIIAAATDDTTIVTPSTLASLFNASSQSTPGYIRIPILVSGAFDEMIIQFGTTGTAAADGSIADTFALTFPTAVRSVAAFPTAGTGAGSGSQGVQSLTTSGFTFYNGTDGATALRWIAIGY